VAAAGCEGVAVADTDDQAEEGGGEHQKCSANEFRDIENQWLADGSCWRFAEQNKG
jgi:hypothetical protein